jgi:hypothetical protein
VETTVAKTTKGGSCEETSRELEEMWRRRETLPTPEEQLMMDPKIDGLIDRLKKICGPTYEETFQGLLQRLKG